MGLYLSSMSENVDSAKNMINMKSVIKTVISTIFIVISIVLLRRFTDQSKMPYSLILGLTVFTMYLVNFAQSPKIKEFWRHKLSQNMTNFRETLIAVKSRVLQLKSNQVGVQVHCPARPAENVV